MGHGHHHHGHGHGHDHGHHHGAPSDGNGARRSLTAALALTSSFMLVEVAVGWWSGSLALLADAGHMLNDAAALGLSLAVTWIAARPRTVEHTYGYRRAEVMGALINAVALGVAGILIIIEAIGRLQAPSEVHGVGMLVAAVIGLLVNLASAWILSRHGGDSINVRAALFHVLSDALGSVAAIVAGSLILWRGWHLADPIASLLIAVFILLGAVRLLRDTTRVLMEAAPEHLDVASLEKTIRETEGVTGVHDLHVWSLVPGVPILSAHVTLRAGAHGTDVAQRVGRRLARDHHVDHSTIQPEAPEPKLISLRRKSS